MQAYYRGLRELFEKGGQPGSATLLFRGGKPESSDPAQREKEQGEVDITFAHVVEVVKCLKEIMESTDVLNTPCTIRIWDKCRQKNAWCGEDLSLFAEQGDKFSHIVAPWIDLEPTELQKAQNVGEGEVYTAFARLAVSKASLGVSTSFSIAGKKGDEGQASDRKWQDNKELAGAVIARLVSAVADIPEHIPESAEVQQPTGVQEMTPSS